MKKRIATFVSIISTAAIFVAGAFPQQSKRPAKRSQTVRIYLTRKGYEPETLSLKRGVPTHLIFVRQTKDDCGREVVIPAYNIRRELPLNQRVDVAFTPRKAGTIGFACGMNMLHGTLIVR
ncbi:MAG TPA: cupredoxin domain-containing protein [Pyrinomonadaceae bacterium]|jgi:P-type Cu+ transporter|nr:cupredoxin domain-containing protein [Pyrinomonadaceae bacterium]